MATAIAIAIGKDGSVAIAIAQAFAIAMDKCGCAQGLKTTMARKHPSPLSRLTMMSMHGPACHVISRSSLVKSELHQSCFISSLDCAAAAVPA